MSQFIIKTGLQRLSYRKGHILSLVSSINDMGRRAIKIIVRVALAINEISESNKIKILNESNLLNGTVTKTFIS